MNPFNVRATYEGFKKLYPGLDISPSQVTTEIPEKKPKRKKNKLVKYNITETKVYSTLK